MTTFSSAARDGLASGDPIEVHGPDGIGKTSLLRHLAHRIEPGEDRALVHASCRRMPVDDLLQLLFESLYECDQAIVATPAELTEYLGEPSAVLPAG